MKKLMNLIRRIHWIYWIYSFTFTQSLSDDVFVLLCTL